MNVFNLDLNVAMDFNYFNVAGNLFRRQGAMHENAFSDKHLSDVPLGTSSQKELLEVLKPMPT